MYLYDRRIYKTRKRKESKNFIAEDMKLVDMLILDNIEPIKPIEAKGQLGIWNHKNNRYFSFLRKYDIMYIVIGRYIDFSKGLEDTLSPYQIELKLDMKISSFLL